MLNRLQSAVTASLISAWMLAPAAHANMLSNASFEDGLAMVPNGRLQLGVGATSVTGWVVTGAPIDLVTTTWWEAPEGTRTLALNSTSAPGGVEQTFVTEPGAAYEVRFQLSGEPFTTPELKTLRVAAAGQHQDFEYDSTTNWHWDMLFGERTWSFVAEGSSTTIQFASLTSGPASPVLDLVTVTRSPVDAGPGPRVAFGTVGPNPVRNIAPLAFAVPFAGPVEVTVHDARGRMLTTLVRGQFGAGMYPAPWNAAGVAPGVYFVTLRAGGRISSQKITLLR